MRHLDLFSGIGGFSIAAKAVWGGHWQSAGFCDNEPFSQAIIKKHFPEAKIYDDIKTLKGNELGPIDLITGGFPCQPFSSAGKRAGKEDDRHLWPHMLRVIREAAPRWVIGENVGGLLTWNGGMVLDEVFADLEASGYEVWAFVIPACAVGAPHRRDRVWIVAHADSRSDGGKAGSDARSGRACRLQERDEVGKPSESDSIRIPPDSTRRRRTEGKQNARGTSKGTTKEKAARHRSSIGDIAYDEKLNTHALYEGLQRRELEKGTGYSGQPNRDRSYERPDWLEDWSEIAARLCPLDDGLPNGSPRPKGWRNAALKGAGNAIVPQVAIQILQAIKEIDVLMYNER